MKKVVIQAGGKGTRLYPYTTVIPKPLMPVGDMPILEIVIKQLVRHDFTNITITTGHLAHLIHTFFGDGSKWGAKISYQTEDKPLGTIGPVRLINDLDGPFLVMNGDLLTDIDYDDVYRSHIREKADLTVACCQKEVPISLGIIDHDRANRIVGFREKPTLKYSVSMGIYVVSENLLSLIPRNTNFGFDDFIFKVLKKKKEAQVYPFSGMWLDIGRYEDYEQATKIFMKNKSKFLPSADVAR